MAAQIIPLNLRELFVIRSGLLVPLLSSVDMGSATLGYSCYRIYFRIRIFQLIAL